MNMLSPGTIIDGRFEILDFIGEGGMGSVYRAKHNLIGRVVALKVLKSTAAAQKEVARFRNEARLLSQLKHPNIIGVHAVGFAETGEPYMAMDMVVGDGLDRIISERGRLPQNEAIAVCIQICDGLHYAHKNKILHRDIKPSNILLTSPNECEGNDAAPHAVAKLVDFGIAKSLVEESQKLTQTGMQVGSVYYLSPGKFQGRESDGATDIYALGCTLYEMLTGTPPYRGNTPFETAMMHAEGELIPVNVCNPDAQISADLEKVIARMLHKNHAARYRSAEHVSEDLKSILNNERPKHASLLARRQGSENNPIVQQKPNRIRMAAIAGGALGLAACVAVGIYVIKAKQSTHDSLQKSAKQTIAERAFEDASLVSGSRNPLQRAAMFKAAADLAEAAGDDALVMTDLRLLAETHLKMQPKNAEDLLARQRQTAEVLQRALVFGSRAIESETNPGRRTRLQEEFFDIQIMVLWTHMLVNQSALPSDMQALLNSARSFHFIALDPDVKGRLSVVLMQLLSVHKEGGKDPVVLLDFGRWYLEICKSTGIPIGNVIPELRSYLAQKFGPQYVSKWNQISAGYQ